MHVQMNTYIHVLSLSMYFPILFTYIEYMFVQPEVNMYLEIIKHASKTCLQTCVVQLVAHMLVK